MLWKNSEVEVYFPDKTPSSTFPCEVMIDSARIVLSYDDDDGPVVYEGTATGEGHFQLACLAQRGKASLHVSPDNEERLEGFWVEAGERGMWTISLDDGEE